MHEHAFAMIYNFYRIRSGIRCTPAMQAGITDHVRELSEQIALLDTPT